LSTIRRKRSLSRAFGLRAQAAALLAVMTIELAAFAQAPATPPKAGETGAATNEKSAPASSPAETAPAPGGAEAAPTETEVSEAVKQEARVHFQKGLALLREEAWGPALAEFMLSRELFPTRAATNNAAIALRRLQRYDEALDMFEALLREFTNLPANERTAAQRAIVELKGLVGTIEIVGAEPGSTISIGGQTRGEYPPVTPLRVPAGTHIVRVFKEGFEAFEGRAEVAGGVTVTLDAKMRKLSQSGRLKVTEQGGRSLDVLVDNVVVGQTPWEGSLAVGDHTVALRGKEKLGTQPVAAPVKPQGVTALTLRAEELDAAMRVEPTPAGARVAINAVTVGRGAWAGRLKSGTHRIEVAADGFLPVVRQVVLERGEREIVAVELQRDPNADFWRKPPKLVLELDGSVALAPSFGGDVIDSCRSECSRSLGVGASAQLFGAYELGSGLQFGLTAGFLSIGQSATDREATLIPNNLDPRPGTASDDLWVRGFLGGLTLGYHVGERFPVLFRLGVGGFLGSVRDDREGTFTTRTNAEFDAFPVTTTDQMRYIFISPEARAGVRFAKNWEASAGIRALLLITPTQPRWNDQIELDAASDGAGTYPADSLTGSFMVLLSPGLSVRYDF
jgi:hypothetical protein